MRESAREDSLPIFGVTMGISRAKGRASPWLKYCIVVGAHQKRFDNPPNGNSGNASSHI